jgi:hypothetical protein
MAGDRLFYLERSYQKAFGQFDPANWAPERGYAANRARILKLYDYYRDTHLARPDRYFWAGLGRLAGGAVVGGLDQFVSFSSEGLFTQTMVKIGKEIFEDLAWQHEAALDDEARALELAGEQDRLHPARRSYREAWDHIMSGEEGRIAKGNRWLLENEQFTIIQKHYDALSQSADAGGLLGPMRSLKAFTNSIHPYHRDFLLSQPTGDIARADNRWSWISETGGMWEKWGERRGVSAAPIVMSRAERARLVQIPMDKLIRREFAPVDATLLPPGAFDI